MTAAAAVPAPRVTGSDGVAVYRRCSPALPAARLQLVPGDHLGAVAPAGYASALVCFPGQR